MKILVGYDGSNAALAAIDLAKTHANAFNADLHIIRSLAQGPTLQKEDIETEEDRLEKLQKSLEKDGIPTSVDTIVSYQTPGEDLVNYAEQHQVDQVIIGVRRRSKVGKLLFGSTAQYVILEAPCPVLTIK